MSNSHYLIRIGEIKIFDELDVNHFLEVAIKRFWALLGEMGLKAITSFESAR